MPSRRGGRFALCEHTASLEAARLRDYDANLGTRPGARLIYNSAMIRPSIRKALSAGFAAAAALLLLMSLAGAAPRAFDEGRPDPPERIPDELDLPTKRQDPLLVRMMIHPIKQGMFIALPIVDSDPNRGVTYGIMPIWVLQGFDETRIRHIHAPSLTFNKVFKWIPTYRYYFYPSPNSAYQFRTSISNVQDREIMFLMEDHDFLNKGIALSSKIQYDVDGSKRFYGIGPDTPTTSESNFTRKIWHYYCRLGLPIFRDSGMKFNFAHHLGGVRVAPGAIDNLTPIGREFPEHAPAHWHQDSEFRLFIDYDSRDNPITTQRGTYAKAQIENSQRGFGSEFTFQRYAIDLRHFRKPTDDSRAAFAGRIKFEQMIGDAPFYLMPTLGGKYTHRAYGEGRYIDKGLLTASVEERFTVYKIEFAGVTTEVEIAPFFELGSSFPTPGRMSRKHFRPVFGSAFRALARPQVVGSVDLGFGQDGAAIFMDINYAF